MATSNKMRALNRLPYDFEDGLKVKGIDIDSLISTNVTQQLSNKQDTLISGTNIKTINGTSILGSGDIVIAGGTGTVPVKFLTDFGALGDGLSSSIAANNAAIASALTYIYSTGFNVIVPPGTYICDPFEINHIGYAGQGTFIGIDRERCIFKRSLSSQGPGAFVTIGNPDNQSFQAGMGMSKIKIDGGATTNGPAIRLCDVVRARFEDCQFTGGNIACDVIGGISITFGSCLFEKATIGVKIDKSAPAAAAGSAAAAGWPNSIHFEGGEMVDNTLLGLWVDSARSISLSHIDIEGNGTSLNQPVQGGVYVGPNMGQEVSINDTSSVGLIVDSCWFESNNGLADIHVKSGLTNIERSTFFSTSTQTTNDIRIEGGRYTVRSVNSSFVKSNNLYESSNTQDGNIIMSSDLPGLNCDPRKTAVYGNSTITMRSGSVPVVTNMVRPLIQGGIETTDVDGNLTVTFPTTYETTTTVTCTPIDVFAGTLMSCSIVSISNAGFTVHVNYINQSTANPVSASDTSISWVSIGAGYN